MKQFRSTPKYIFYLLETILYYSIYAILSVRRGALTLNATAGPALEGAARAAVMGKADRRDHLRPRQTSRKPTVDDMGLGSRV